MGLRELKTDLKSLKFGKDRFGGGSSGQPYIQTPIPKTEDDPSFTDRTKDFLWRGGLKAPIDSAEDALRLSKYFVDLKSPSGLLFITKQNLLSRTAVATQASGKVNWRDAALNENVYTPLSTIIQAGQNYIGGHANKQGLNPLGDPLIGGLKTYMDVVKSTTLPIASIVSVKNNRLLNLLDEHVGRFSSTNILSYSGGPGSTLGLGRTNIPFATNNKGGITKVLGNDPIDEKFIESDPFSLTVPDVSNVLNNSVSSFLTNQTGIANQETNRDEIQSLFRTPLNLSLKYAKLVGGDYLKSSGNVDIFTNKGIGLASISNGSGFTWNNNFNTSVYNPGTLISNQEINHNGSSTWTQQQIQNQVNLNNAKNSTAPSIQDFRAPLLEDELKKENPNSTIISGFNSYTDPNKVYEGTDSSRVNMSSPGQKGNRISYTKGKILQSGTSQERVSIVDRINYLPIYKSSTNRSSTEDGINDFVKFRIAAVLRSGEKVYSHFRAFINSFSDGYTAEWSGTKYMGRGEELYKYGGFGRKISLSYTVAAQSKPELMAQYKKLNFLASTLAPDYSDSGYMGGVLTTLTLGGWCYELPGFINSLSLEVPQESPWDIAIADEVIKKGSGDPNVKEMPHICNVSMEYTPIHRFTPQLQDNTWDGKEIKTYGDQRYIGLTQGSNNNYKSVSLSEAAIPDTKQFVGGSGFKK